MQVILQLISFDKIIWGFISQNNEHGVMQPLRLMSLEFPKTQGFSVN